MKKILPITMMATMVVATPLTHVLAADYTVKSGDTLWGISNKSNTTIQELMTWNNLKTTTLSIGQKLTTSKPAAPAPTSGSTVSGAVHTVVKGDTLWGISSKYKVTVSNLMSWNQLKSTTLVIGQQLKIGTATTVPVVSNVENITLLSGLFKSPGKDRVSAISPQRVTVLQRGTDGWIQIKTWLGPLWTKNGVTTESVAAVPVTLTAKTTDYLNLRTTASTTASTILVIPMGATVKVLDKSTSWWKIEYNGKIGYSSAAYLKETTTTVSSPTPAPVAVQEKAQTTANLYFREAASATGKVISIMPTGTVVTVLDRTGSWWKISLNGKTGYASGDYLKLATGTSAPVASNGKIVVLDPGHGGSDPGATNGRIYEKNVALAHALKTKSYLEKMGYTVHMTRNGDTTCIAANGLGSGSNPELDCRTVFASVKKADVFVSIHANASVPGVRGTETFYNNGTVYNGKRNPEPAKSGKLATAVHSKYQPVFASRNRGVKTANYYVNNNATMPSILMEIGFMTDLTDLNKLTNATMQDKVSRATAEGIDNYFKN